MKNISELPEAFESSLNRNGFVPAKFNGWWPVWSRNGNKEGALLIKGGSLVIAFPPKSVHVREISEMTCCIWDEFVDDIDLMLYFGEKEPIELQAPNETLDFVKQIDKPVYRLSEVTAHSIFQKSPRLTYDGTHKTQTVRASGNLITLPDGLEFRSVDYLGNRRWLFIKYTEIKDVRFTQNRATTLGMVTLAKVTANRILKPRITINLFELRGGFYGVRFYGTQALYEWPEIVENAKAFYQENILDSMADKALPA
ncbi:MAG TPA: hypothetical protein PKV16_05235 [Caldisericia bacterium]|nr:hypothetical protein [Caldisericia bacterium]HPF48717.1 hypothetical protein [Caldisericia bacterium]HPI83623.1 hypothetical protein [Caldisericia bacterium]HPQ93172.1 hypothetical protein [Caldisericia bacterium]HRV74995.1 hypothetical protein [Caldisericia bacterium]